MDYAFLFKLGGVVATLGLFSVLYKENKVYRFFEHVFLGLASGWSLVVLWWEVLKPLWYDKIVGSNATGGAEVANGYWAYVLLLPIGLMSYLVFSKKHNWISRIPLGIILGIWSGQQIQNWANTYLPQVKAAMKPIFPTTFDQFTVPKEAIEGSVYPSQAISNFLFVFTILSVLSYFLFSFEVKNKAWKMFNSSGRYLLMIGFGAIFGSTVTMRFTLLIDRMYFVCIEFFKNLVLPMFGG